MMRTIQFLAVVLTAIALIPAGVHLAEMPNKIDMAQSAYFTTQDIYRGWAVFGFVLMAAILADLALAIATRAHRTALVWASTAFALMVASVAIFFLWTEPANVATEYWTVAPPNWEAWRTQWEYAHAGAAVVTLLAFLAVVLSVLSYPGPRQVRN